MRSVPDALYFTDTSETMEYIQGWNDCRAAMLAEQPVQQEPLEYSNAVDGWVKIGEVREHFNLEHFGALAGLALICRHTLTTLMEKTDEGRMVIRWRRSACDV